jgi:UDP:flavonoid glycosyltransferase YjiC (YdhE family)
VIKRKAAQLLEGAKPLLLVFPYNVMAHYLRCLQLCKYLKPWFEIRFIYSKQFDSFVAEAGFETFECASLHAEKVQQCMSSFNFSWLNERDLNVIYNDQVKAIVDLQPAAVLGDMSPTLQMAAEKTGAFYFSLMNGYMSKHYAYGRRMPSKHPLFKLVNFLPGSLLQYFIYLGENLFFEDMHRPFSSIRKRAGLSARHSYLQELEGDANLVCDLPDLFPQKNLPLNYFSIPPLFHIGTDEIPAMMKNLDAHKKTLYVSMGSTGNWHQVTFLNNDEYKKFNIVTAGDHEKLIYGLNVFSCEFVNSHKLFTLIDLVICHAGNGTVYQALSHGVPVLCKTSHVEQEYNVDGIERLGLGKSLDEIEPADYFAMIEAWVENKYSKKLLCLKKKISDSNSRFEIIIENLLNVCFHKNKPKEAMLHSEAGEILWKAEKMSAGQI